MSITVPPNHPPGQPLQFSLGGQIMSVTVPVGVLPGQSFAFQVAAPPVAAETVPMGIALDETLVRPQGVGERYAECPICFEPLHRAAVGVFIGPDGRRVSNHFFALAAARTWLASGNGFCPLTRKPIGSVLQVPDLATDPDGWFACCDVDGDGRLSRAEAIECIKAQCAVDVAALDAAITDGRHWMWEQWDKDGSGWLERHELLAPNGLVASVRELFAPAARGAIPSIHQDKGAWYDHWDEDRSGSLEREEVVRALLKTLGLTTDQAKVQQMRSTVEAIWPIFDTDGSGSVERHEFLRPGDGLADTILATLAHG